MVNADLRHPDRVGARPRQVPRQGVIEAVIDLPVRAAHDRGRAHPARALRRAEPDRHRPRVQGSGVVMALLFVTLPFVVRTVEPVLIELDQEMEEAAVSLGASRFTTFRRVVFPNLLPRSRPARRCRSPGRSASSGRPCSSPATCRSRPRFGGLHLRADRERRPRSRLRSRWCCSCSRSWCCSRSTGSSAGAGAVAERDPGQEHRRAVEPALRRDLLRRHDAAAPGRAPVLAHVRARHPTGHRPAHHPVGGACVPHHASSSRSGP